MSFPIYDLHCDLLLYLGKVPGAHIDATTDIGVTRPFLKAGHVRHQTLAIFTRTEKSSTSWLYPQLDAFQKLSTHPDFLAVSELSHLTAAEQHDKIGITLAIENASALVEEEEPLDKCFERLEHCLQIGKRLMYITLTHHAENRFGGGNYTNVGLKRDGEAMLEYIAERSIPVDLSHTSAQMAVDILAYIDRQNLPLPVLASHSNFRVLRDHPRNLTHEIVQELIHRQGLIGANFLRLFLDGDTSTSLLDHIEYGLANAPAQMAFGADFFYRPGIPDPARQPLFFPEYEDAGQYPKILQELAQRNVGALQLQQLASGNARRFLEKHWQA